MEFIFKYYAKDATGIGKDGEIKAVDEKDAVKKLQEQGLFVISIEKLRKEEKPISSVAPTSPKTQKNKLVFIIIGIALSLTVVYDIFTVGFRNYIDIISPLVLVLSSIIIMALIVVVKSLYPKMNIKTKIITISFIALLILPAIYFTFKGCAGSPVTGGNISISDAKVFVHAEDFVRARLPCPSTARFPSLSSGIVKNLGNNVYEYAGYVDSQNVYGAMVRSKYYVEMEFTGDECRLLNITIE